MTLPGWVGVREPRGRLGGRYAKNVTICPTQACTTPKTALDASARHVRARALRLPGVKPYTTVYTLLIGDCHRLVYGVIAFLHREVSITSHRTPASSGVTKVSLTQTHAPPGGLPALRLCVRAVAHAAPSTVIRVAPFARVAPSKSATAPFGFAHAPGRGRRASGAEGCCRGCIVYSAV